MSTPRYQTVYDSLLSRIRSGEFPPGAMIPKELDLTAEYGVSRITVTRAVKDLQALGILIRVKGTGTFVRDPGAAGTGDPAPGALPRVAVLFPQGEKQGAPEMLMGIEQVCSRAGYLVTIHISRGSVSRERELLEELELRRPAALLLYPTSVAGENSDLVGRFLARRVPVVLVDRRLPSLAIPLVACDNREGARILTSHLLDRGRRKIAFFAHSLELLSSEAERHAGYLQALIGAGIAPDPRLVRMVGPGGLEEALDAVLALGADAVFAVNDLLAIAVMRALGARGLAVPGAVAVAGFDDIEAASLVTPPLTTLRQPFEAIGARAAEVLLASLAGGTPPAETEARLPGLLVVRKS